MERPALARGVTLGPLDHRGLPAYRLVSPAGREWQVRPLLYHVAVHADGTRTPAELARLASGAMGSPVTAEAAEAAVCWLAARGLIEGTAAPETPEPAPGFAQIRLPLFRGPALAAAATGLRFLFRPRWAAALLLLSVAVRLVPYEAIPQMGLLRLVRDPWGAFTPGQAAALGAIVLAAGLVHELGHAAAAHAAGLRAGEIGVGLNLIYPVYYTKIDHVWAGSRRQRLVISAGGVYFQLLAGGLLWTYYLSDPGIAAALPALPNDLAVLANLQPFLRFDGYWMLSHLCGIVNLAGRGWGQLIEWATLGRVRDGFLRAYGPLQRLVIAAYGTTNAAFMAMLAWGLIRWSGFLLPALSRELWLAVTAGLNPERLWVMAQGGIWLVLIINTGRRFRRLPGSQRRRADWRCGL